MHIVARGSFVSLEMTGVCEENHCANCFCTCVWLCSFTPGPAFFIPFVCSFMCDRAPAHVLGPDLFFFAEPNVLQLRALEY